MFGHFPSLATPVPVPAAVAAAASAFLPASTYHHKIYV